MKKLAFASVAAIALAGTASAEFIQAPSGGSAELEVEINGEVEEICGITATSSSLLIEFDDLADTDGSLKYPFDFGVVCNSAGGAILSATSANSGALLRNGTETGVGNEISYKLNIDRGVDGLPYTTGTPPKGLASPISYTINGSTALREGAEVGGQFELNGVKGPDFQGAPTTTVYAGVYSDTVTIALSAQ